MPDSPVPFRRRTPEQAAAFRARAEALWPAAGPPRSQDRFFVHHGCRAVRTSANRWKIFVYGAEVHEASSRLDAIAWIDQHGPDFTDGPGPIYLFDGRSGPPDEPPDESTAE